jgi:glycine betaine/choline ABC-type transport system substrate-binding protein
MRRWLGVALAMLLVSGCAQPPVTVGSKQAVQDRIVAEMMARMIEEAGLPVKTRLGIGDSGETYEALRAGAIDVYPEYTGTARALVGLPHIGDQQAERAELDAIFGALGFRFLAPFGFESSFVVVTRRSVADSRGLSQLSDLGQVSRQLRLGVSRGFAERPADGLNAFINRFDLKFRDVEIVPERDRERLYEMLIEDRIDVAVGFSTDPQITDFGLVVLPDETGFFPVYEAVPLAAEASLAAHPGLADALAPLAGVLTADKLRDLVREVQIGGAAPKAVAIRALADAGLVEAVFETPQIPLAIAVNAAELGGSAANTALRAVRMAMPGRAVATTPAADPIVEIIERKARLAVVPAAAHFRYDSGEVVRDERLEAIGVVGSSVVHAIARVDGPESLAEADVIATGPVGSPSHLIGQVLAQHAEREVRLRPLADGDLASAKAALDSGRADAAIVVATRGRGDLKAMFAETDGLRLIDSASWWRGAPRLALPFLRPATLSRQSYPELNTVVPVLAMQTVLTGPAPSETSALGQQGPSSFTTRIGPLTDAKVRAIDAALGPRPDVIANLRRARALSPEIQPQATARNPHPDQALLTLGIFGFIAFAGWLLVRRGPGDNDA